MKKLLSLFMGMMLLPLALNAITLEPNQLVLGHYASDDIKLGGCWGKSFLNGVTPIATDITPDELVLFQGSKIVAFRVGLSLSTPVSRVFVIPVDPNGNLMEETSWSCNVSDQGWNLVQLETPYEINLPEGYSLRIGFDYLQSGSAKPISAVKVGNIYPTLCYFGNKWSNLGVDVYGNLSLQCIAENDNFPQYILRADNFINRTSIKTGDDVTFSFETRNLGVTTINPGALTFDVAIDGNVVKTISNPAAIGNEKVTISDMVSSEGLVAGMHTITVTTATLNGQPIEDPIVLTGQFKNFDYGYSRQMRLVEQFTSTYCTYCPQGTANIQSLCNMRNDIAWVSIHENMGNTDPFRTEQTDSITSLQGINGFPEGSFDRTVGIEANNRVYAVLTNLQPSRMSTFLDNISETPSWATVNVNSTFDETTRKAVITIDGELVPNYEDFMGNDSKLTVYITEDGLVAPQVSGGNDYVHNNVLRQALVSVKGVALKKNGNAYKNEFTVTIPGDWKADNLNIVAFVSRPLGNALTDIYVTNANKRKLGEFDEPTSMRGDLDGDGNITIADISMLIDYILDPEATTVDIVAADCDQNGEVNIADVPTLIDRLLSGNW